MARQTTDPLLERLRSGDHEAFNDLVRGHHSSLFRLANRLLRNVDDAQEVVQEAFLAAYEGMPRFRGHSKLGTWLLSICYNKAVDRLKQRRHNVWSISGELEDTEAWQKAAMVDHFTEWRTNPEQNVVRMQLAEGLEQALSGVPALSKAVFELRDLQGYTTREVAVALDLNEGAVRVRLHRVRQYLTAELQHLFERHQGEER